MKSVAFLLLVLTLAGCGLGLEPTHLPNEKVVKPISATIMNTPRFMIESNNKFRVRYNVSEGQFVK